MGESKMIKLKLEKLKQMLIEYDDNIFQTRIEKLKFLKEFLLGFEKEVLKNITWCDSGIKFFEYEIERGEVGDLEK